MGVLNRSIVGKTGDRPEELHRLSHGDSQEFCPKLRFLLCEYSRSDCEEDLPGFLALHEGEFFLEVLKRKDMC